MLCFNLFHVVYILHFLHSAELNCSRAFLTGTTLYFMYIYIYIYIYTVYIHIYIYICIVYIYIEETGHCQDHFLGLGLHLCVKAATC